MKTYNKRIGFLISSQHLIPHGGIGQFAKSFVEMCNRMSWKVDIILDKNTDIAFADLIKTLGANIICPEKAVSYNIHTGFFSYSDSINFEKIQNFRDSIIKALNTNIYDMFVCNTQESMSAMYAIGIQKYIPVVFYTHLHSMIFRKEQNFADVFIPSYHNFFNKHMEFSDVYIGTQSKKNIAELSSYGANSVLLRMPLSERDLLVEHRKERKGVLFIGRWEDGKNPQAFIKAIELSKLPAKVMTNESGQKKFKAEFEKLGITDYEIKAGIVGKEKIEFITSAKLFFMPSLRENYPFAFYECLGHMPCIVLDKQDWSENFNSKFFYKVPESKVPDLLISLYDTVTSDEYYQTGALEYVNSLDGEVTKEWMHFLYDFEGKKSNSNTAKINNEHTTTYADFILSLKRKHISREDIESVLGNKHKFRVIYTDKDTYLTKDPSFEPVEQQVGLGLFEGL
jgi:glycosyltransferase involved in cell wall biosynthesis